jgi:hypothetical protein
LAYSYSTPEAIDAGVKLLAGAFHTMK